MNVNCTHNLQDCLSPRKYTSLFKYQSRLADRIYQRMRRDASSIEQTVISGRPCVFGPCPRKKRDQRRMVQMPGEFLADTRLWSLSQKVSTLRKDELYYQDIGSTGRRARGVLKHDIPRRRVGDIPADLPSCKQTDSKVLLS